uniref:Uncharacterized protein n=1 Tax=Glossina palpalis gambiensis TaxID=67801 RepID=A0A1B0ATV0_9MUSC
MVHINIIMCKLFLIIIAIIAVWSANPNDFENFHDSIPFILDIPYADVPAQHIFKAKGGYAANDGYHYDKVMHEIASELPQEDLLCFGFEPKKNCLPNALSVDTTHSYLQFEAFSRTVRLSPNKTASTVDGLRTFSPSSTPENFPFARRESSRAAFSRAKSLFIVLVASSYPSSSAYHAYDVCAVSYNERQTAKCDIG